MKNEKLETKRGASPRASGDISRRDITSILGAALGLSALAACDPNGAEPASSSVPEALVASAPLVTVDAIADLHTFTATTRPALVLVLGYYAPRDGGGGTFTWDASSVDDDDGGLVIASPGFATGRWKRAIGPREAVSILQFGAKDAAYFPTFSNDDVFKRAIAACILPGDPATRTRGAIRPLHIPNGFWRITAPILITSVQGFQLRGSGSETYIHVDADIKVALDLNGVAYSSFSDFNIITGGGHAVVHGIRLYHRAVGDAIDPTDPPIPAASRSTTQNTFTRVGVQGKFVRGWFIGYDIATGRQVDNDSFIHCRAEGAWVHGQETYWQYGFHVGEGLHANNLNHSFFHIEGLGCRFVLMNAATNLQVYGGGLDAGEAAYKHSTAGLTTISGIRSESCERFLASGGPAGWISQLRLTDICYYGNNVSGDGWLEYFFPGVLTLTNVRMLNPRVPSKMRFFPGGAVRPGYEGRTRLVVTMDNVATEYDLDNLFTRVPGITKVVYRAYAKIAATAEVDYVEEQGVL